MVTSKERKTYLFIRHYILRNGGEAPTEAEIASGIGITSRGTVHRYVKSLADQGLIEIIPNKKRNIRLSQEKILPYCTLPIIGKIAAGSPIEALEEGRVLDLTERLLGPNRFVFEVKGDSMIGDNICDGDYIICETRTEAEQQEIVVAVVDQQEVTLKRLQRNDDNTITLLSSNPAISPMVYSADRVKIQGVYIGLLRLGELSRKTHS